MEIHGNIQRGWPSQVISTLSHLVFAYVQDGTYFKIGITNDPYTRSRQYEYAQDQYEYYGPWYDTMLVIYETSSINNVRELESKLIEDFRGFCDNTIGGGGGRVGIGPYYLYIVLAH